jgi:hypothetical protein
MSKKLVKCYIWTIALYGAETWTLRAEDQKYLESFEMWCWRRMEKISWTDHVRKEVLLRVNEQRNILHEIRKRRANPVSLPFSYLMYDIPLFVNSKQNFFISHIISPTDLLHPSPAPYFKTFQVFLIAYNP